MRVKNVTKIFSVNSWLGSTTSLNASLGIVLDNVCGDLHRNAVTVLLGGNGAGKTTLLRILSGMEKRYDGTIHIFDSHRNAGKIANNTLGCRLLNHGDSSRS